jgi:pyruvate,water dikinase
VIRTAHAAGRKIGICGQAPSDYPDFAQFLVAQGIDSISLNPDSLLKTMVAIIEAEKKLALTPPAATLATSPDASSTARV